MNSPYKTKIGLEIHIQPKTESKMFCRCKNEFNNENPNTSICEICTGQPGTLPAANKRAIEAIIKAGIALNCDITRKVHWDRKHYFYPDLPKGYQLTQNTTALCQKGFLEFDYLDEKGRTQNKKVLINRLHLEEDAGKDTHPEGADYSLVDLNRAGAPLIELVTEPVIENKEQAAAFCRNLQKIFRYLKVSDADMEKGQMRCEVNISLGQNGKDGTKVEIKNINSFKGVRKSIEYEIKRQSEILNEGGKVKQETRGWKAQKQITVSQRGKEDAHDYRYFPEPDIPIVNITDEWLEKIKSSISELPQQKKERFIKNFNINEDIANSIIGHPDLAEYFDKTISELKAWSASQPDKLTQKELEKLYKLASNYLTTEITKMVSQAGLQFKEIPITPENFAELMLIIRNREINSSAAQKILKIMFKTKADPSQIIDEHNLRIEKNESAIEKTVDEVLKQNEKAVKDLKQGKNKALQFLMGQVMKKSADKADPKTTIEMIKRKTD
ncbi:MAG: Asp-tRNA(Asn)/Glu-tRNA(Gln) amidotransferase subunit GatB [Candidatus Moranbacteria bacterium]|nr:Asp-tRNA(Asn)/Glu-tRNA(Gln) amidotransferase subunit GatB [Candidatus Moranbacteria bacterium]